MVVVGQNDAFERRYMEKFRSFASKFGEFVKYEHDRGAQDIGIHLIHYRTLLLSGFEMVELEVVPSYTLAGKRHQSRRSKR